MRDNYQMIYSLEEMQERIQVSLDILQQAEIIAGMGSWEYDLSSEKLLWSDGMYRLYNLPAESEVSFQTYLDLAEGGDKEFLGKLVEKIRAGDDNIEATIMLSPVGKKRRVIRLKAHVLNDNSKGTEKMVGVDLDITNEFEDALEIHNLNAALHLRNAELNALNSELKTFNNVTAKDYKDSLQTLYTNLEFVIRTDGFHLSDSSKSNMRRAQSAIQKMKLLTDDINSYLQLYELEIKVSVVEVEEILKKVLSRLEEKIKKTEAKIEFTGLKPILADPDLLLKLIYQLLDNSIKFNKLNSPPKIRIAYSIVNEMNSISEAEENMSYGVISITDNGIGFQKEEEERIFELFYRKDDPGNRHSSGIGLAICKKIMSLHRGFITAEGRPANGATFNCYFPLENPAS